MIYRGHNLTQIQHVTCAQLALDDYWYTVTVRKGPGFATAQSRWFLWAVVKAVVGAWAARYSDLVDP